jgi:hypothetical protein
MSREAMQIALDALEANLGNWAAKTKAVEVLRQALETEQKPVAWLSEGGDVSRSKRYMDEMGFKCNPLYTAPPNKEWVGLTDDAVFELADTNLYEGGKNFGVLAFAKAIEQALKEKNNGRYRNRTTTERTKLKEKNQ